MCFLPVWFNILPFQSGQADCNWLQILIRISDAKVRAIFRNETKAAERLGKLQKDYPFRMELVQCDLGNRRELREAMIGVDQVFDAARAVSVCLRSVL